MPATQLAPGVMVQVLQGITTGSRIIAISPKIRLHTILIRGTGAVSAGAVKVSTASADAFAGAWAAIGTPVVVVANGEAMANFGPIVLNYLKIEISTTVVGGVASVYYIGGE